MGKITSRDYPPELKTFWEIFQKLGYRHEYITVFSDFLDICIWSFSHEDKGFMEIRDNAMKRYNPEEHKLFNELFYEMIRVYDKRITADNEWYDFFGHMYETLASSSKKSGFGQFFTPETVVTFMTQGTCGELLDKDEEGNFIQKGKLITDCACGSGRMLLASHAANPHNIHFGSDLDSICSRMTAVNMFMHGCKGEAIQMNTLSMEWMRGYLINAYGLGIWPLAKCNSYVFGSEIHFRQQKQENTEKKPIHERVLELEDELVPEPLPEPEPVQIQSKPQPTIKDVDNDIAKNTWIQGSLF